jgi:hypothetical protein
MGGVIARIGMLGSNKAAKYWKIPSDRESHSHTSNQIILEYLGIKVNRLFAWTSFNNNNKLGRS